MRQGPGVRIGWGAVLAALAAGCGVTPSPAGFRSFKPTRKVDMLFVIDDSSFTVRMQQNLVSNFPAFLNRLSDPPGLPDLHIAVISTNMGAGDGSIDTCNATGGDNGIFQYRARGTCVATGLDPGATYIVETGTVRNYTGNLDDVFACIAMLGESGCGFEHQLASISRALGADGRPPPQENQGFLRPDAYLFVVVVTDEDDCSALPGSPLFDTKTNTSLDSPLGLPTSFRCNEFGHLCNGVQPPRRPPTGSVDDIVMLEGCRSAEEAGMLIPVGALVAQLRSLKSFPDEQIMVAAIAGPSTPYSVRWMTRPPADNEPRPHITPSCTSPDAHSAAPSVRIADWIQSFGGNGLMISACDDAYTPVLDRLSSTLSRIPSP
jgi:hypothetical protein